MDCNGVCTTAQLVYTKKMSFAVIDAKQGCKLFGCRTSQAVNYLGAEQVSCKDLDVVLSQMTSSWLYNDVLIFTNKDPQRSKIYTYWQGRKIPPQR